MNICISNFTDRPLIIESSVESLSICLDPSRSTYTVYFSTVTYSVGFPRHVPTYGCF